MRKSYSENKFVFYFYEEDTIQFLTPTLLLVPALLLTSEQLLRNKAVYADVLESNGVEHTRRSFHNTLHRIARPRHACNAFHNNRTELVQVHEINVFAAVTEGAGCCHDGVPHLDSADIYAAGGFHFLHKNNDNRFVWKFQDWILSRSPFLVEEVPI